MANIIYSKKTTLVFDVNETLLDLSVMKAPFTDAFGHEGALKQWFAFLLQYSMVSTLTNNYHNFDVIGESVLDMTAHAFQVSLSAEKKRALSGLIRNLPPHPEVAEGLDKLKNAGFQLVSFTNSSQEVAHEQLDYAQLSHFFAERLSVEAIGKFKPHPQVYQAAAYRLGKKPEDMRMVAAHAWDVAGAMQAGWKSAFVARNGIPLFSLAQQKPGIIEKDILEVAQEIIKQEA